MGLLTKKPPEPAAQAQSTTDPLRDAANAKIEAAKRLDAAVIEVEASITALLAAEDDFVAKARKANPDLSGISGSVRRLLRTLLLGQMQASAPQLIKFLDLPYIPARGRGPIAASVERTTANEFHNYSQVEEQAQ